MITEIIVTHEFTTWYEALSLDEQLSVRHYVTMLSELGVSLPHPYSSGIMGSKFSSMRELRVQHAGRPYRVLYAFDPMRNAVLLMGGDKTGKGERWYAKAIHLADKLFEEYLRGIK
jgi:hypothetical protein